MIIQGGGSAQSVGSVATWAVVSFLKSPNINGKFPGTTERVLFEAISNPSHTHTGTGWKRLGWQRFRVDHKLTETVNTESQAQRTE